MPDISSPNLPLQTAIDEVLGNKLVGGVMKTARMSVSALALIIASQAAFDGQVRLSADPVAGDARKALQFKADGGVEARPRKITVLCVYTQSNGANKATVSWQPPQNLFVWNGGNWLGDLVPPLGTAFEPADPTKISVPVSWAAEYARDHPEEDVYLIVIARGGTGVRHLVGVDYVYDDGLSGNPGTGRIGFDNATPGSISQIRYSETDDDGYIRFLAATTLQVSAYYPARVEVIGTESTFIEFYAGASFLDNGAWRHQEVTYSSSANWPPANGTPVRVFGGGPRMKAVMTANVEAAFDWLELTGADRVFRKVFLWPTESDINYYDSYLDIDFPKLLETLSTWTKPETSFLFTLPWPYGTGISTVRAPWWDMISAIVVENFNTRKLVSLEGMGADAWTDLNKIHVAGASMQAMGEYIYRSEIRGGTSPRTLSAGRYTPVLTAVTNLDAVTQYPMRFTRVGPNTLIGGMMGIDATAAGNTLTEAGISLPIASNFYLGTECNGIAVGVGVPSYGAIGQDGPNDRAKLVLLSVHTSPILLNVQFSYEINPF